ncbi:MAG: UDP-N-acetylmuramoyl-L-alanine--D-glutamate ligase, partial [Rhodobacteraceae bacterium]|nr:UDP-N-acetylmuramoyl-L-alanine--D-glutamate ligase [Paracoccaceae bacterium]
MIPVRGYDGHKVAVLGLGRSGMPAVAALRAGGAEVVAWDDGEAARARAAAEGIAITDLARADAWAGVKALVVSPGIPHLYPAPHPAVAAAWAAGVAVDNDVGLFFRSFATPAWEEFARIPQVVAITGSNGKSTTTALLAHVLAASGRPVQMGGNIGRGVLDLEPAEDGMVVVLELSSYQTELARALQPDIAVFLNLS